MAVYMPTAAVEPGFDPAEEVPYGTRFDVITQVMWARMRMQGPTLRSMHEIRQRYYGEWVLPDLQAADLGNLAPAIVADTIDHTGMRANEVSPMIRVPQLQRGDEDSREKMIGRKKMLHWTRQESGWSVAGGRFFRHLAAYGTACIMAKPDFDAEAMRIRVRDPLGCFPDPRAPEDLSPPTNAGFVYGKSASWIRSKFPKSRAERGGCIPEPRQAGLDTEMWELVEWWDHECMVIGILGPRLPDDIGVYEQVGFRYAVELMRVPNRIGFVPVTVPIRLTLDRVASQVSNILGHVDVMARFAALDMMASEKAIFPDKYIIGNRDGVAPQLVGGHWLDGRSGKVNLIQDAAAVGELRGTPDPSGKIAHDRFERNAKVSGGMIPQQVGEEYGNARSGRQIDAIIGAAIDPRILEMHNIASYAFQAVNRAVLAGNKKPWGSKTFYMYSGLEGDDLLKATPDELIEVVRPAGVEPQLQPDGTTVDVPVDEMLLLHNAVEYPVPGADLQGTTIVLGQLLAAKVMGRRDFRDRHPWIPDSDIFERNVFEEDLVDTLSQSLRQGVLSGTTAMPDAVEILAQYRKTGDEVAAFTEADRLARERQAALAPPPGEGQATAPEAQPGLSPAITAGAESQAAPEDTTFRRTDRQANLRQLVLALKTNPQVRP
jgi:hypothetical protein